MTEPTSGPDDFEDLGIEIPDDLSGLAEAGAPADEPTVTVLVTQVAQAKPLAAACALLPLAADVVPSPIGAIVVLRSAPDVAAGVAAAEALSRALSQAPILLLDRRGGRIEASRWNGGVREDDLAPGLVLSGAPSELEDLLLGARTSDELPGMVSSVGMSRWAAMRALSSGRRRRGGSA